jgi:hypothetical protein
MADTQERAAERAAQDAERARAAAVRERRAQRDELADLERQRADLDGRIGALRAEMATGPVDESAVFEVMVDSLGSLGEHVKGDILRPGDAEYDFGWLHRSGSVRRLSAGRGASAGAAADGVVHPPADAGTARSTWAHRPARSMRSAWPVARSTPRSWPRTWRPIRAERAEAANAGEVVVKRADRPRARTCPRSRPARASRPWAGAESSR